LFLQQKYSKKTTMFLLKKKITTAFEFQGNEEDDSKIKESGERTGINSIMQPNQ